MNEVIATQEILGITAEGEDILVIVKIGRPYQVPGHEDIDEWACPVSLKPLFNNLHDIHGSGSLQALSLGMGFVINLLESFVEKGGRLVHEDKTDIPLDSYGFKNRNHT